MDIRLLTNSDKEAFGKLYSETILTEFSEYSEKTLKYFAEGKYKDNMWRLPIKLGAFAEDALIGYLLSENPIGGVAFVHWLAIAKKYQGQGIGRALLVKLDAILKEKGAHSSHLQADKKNIPFYEKCGYEVYGFDDKGYFGAKDYLLRKILQEPIEDKFFS